MGNQRTSGITKRGGVWHIDKQFRGARICESTGTSDLTQAGEYLAEHPERAALSAKDVADAYGIPAQLLAKILQLLTKNGMLKSHAGMNGGYALSRDAHAISAYEVIHSIDGPFFITSCTKGAKGCDLTPSCTIKEPLARVNDTIAGVLKSISIQDLAEKEHPAVHETSPLVYLTLS